MAEDPQLELAQRRPRLQPELDEHLSAAPVGGERVRLPAAAVEGHNELSEQPLARGIVGDERLQLRHERRPLSPVEFGLDPLLDRRHAELVELSRVRDERRNVAQRASTPERECLRKLSLLDQLAETNRIDRDTCVERVAGRCELDRVRAEQLAQPRHIGLHDLGRARRRLVLPQHVLNHREPDRASNMQREQRQKRPLLRRPQLRRLAIDQHLERAKQADLDRHTPLSTRRRPFVYRRLRYLPHVQITRTRPLRRHTRSCGDGSAHRLCRR